MAKPGNDRRTGPEQSERTPFGTVVRAAIGRRMQETRGDGAHWVSLPNLAWVRWAREDGRFVYCAIRRRMDHLTGEIGVAHAPLDLEQLAPVHAMNEASLQGCRILLGYLVEGHDKWWSTSGTEKGFNERVDWLAQQLRLQVQKVVNASARRAA